MSAEGEVTDLYCVYKITDTAPPSPLPHALPTSALDMQDGFIHTSTASRCGQTADEFFGKHTRLWLLKIDVRKTRSTVDDPGRALWADLAGCVHIHPLNEGGMLPRLGKDNVLGTQECVREVGKTWREAMAELTKQGWMLDKDEC
jgi:hypothetical protein